MTAAEQAMPTIKSGEMAYLSSRARRVAGAAGLAMMALPLLAGVFATAPSGLGDTTSAWISWFTSNPRGIAVNAVVVAAAGALNLVLLNALRKLLIARDLAAPGPATTVLAVGAVWPAWTIAYNAVQAVAALTAAADAQSAALPSLVRTYRLIGGTYSTVAVTMGVSLILAGLALRRSTGFPRILGYLGLLGGAAGTLGAIINVVTPPSGWPSSGPAGFAVVAWALWSVLLAVWFLATANRSDHPTDER